MLPVLFLAFTGRESKTELLCHKWREIGTKLFGKTYHRIDKSQSELVEFNKDGTYEKLVYGNLRFKGRWLLIPGYGSFLKRWRSRFLTQ